MPVYAYKGLNEKGRNVGGIIDADSPKSARIKLRRSGVFPTDLNETREKLSSATAQPASRFNLDISGLFERITPQDLSLMTRQLPTMTIILLAISGFLANYWWVVIGLAVAVGTGVRLWKRTPAGHLQFDRLVLRIPYFGKVLKKVALARFARTLSTLLLGGIPLLQALDIVKHVVSNMVLSNAIEDSR